MHVAMHFSMSPCVSIVICARVILSKWLPPVAEILYEKYFEKPFGYSLKFDFPFYTFVLTTQMADTVFLFCFIYCLAIFFMTFHNRDLVV